MRECLPAAARYGSAPGWRGYPVHRGGRRDCASGSGPSPHRSGISLHVRLREGGTGSVRGGSTPGPRPRHPASLGAPSAGRRERTPGPPRSPRNAPHCRATHRRRPYPSPAPTASRAGLLRPGARAGPWFRSHVRCSHRCIPPGPERCARPGCPPGLPRDPRHSDGAGPTAPRSATTPTPFTRAAPSTARRHPAGTAAGHRPGLGRRTRAVGRQSHRARRRPLGSR